MRKEQIVRMPNADGNRDSGKVYVLTEMPAARAEKWGIKALAALAKGGLDIPDEAAAMGMAGVAAMGMNAFAGLDFHLIEPLLDEMMECVQFVPDPSRMDVRRPLMTDDDIEEISTRLQLRKDIFELHTGFFARADQLKSTQEKSRKKRNYGNT